MPVFRDKRGGKWRWRKLVRLPNGTKRRIRGTPQINTKEAALADERRSIEALLNPEVSRKEVPTFKEWFNDRFWLEHVVSRENKPSEVESKKSIYKHHLEPYFGSTRLDEIDTLPPSRASVHR